MPITVADTVRIAVIGRWTNGHPMTCVLDYSMQPVSGGDFGGGPAAQAVGDAWKAYIVPNMLNNYTFEGVQWTTLDTADGDTGFYPPNVTGSNVGGGTNAASQPATAILVRKTGSGGRGSRQGRMYLPPPGEATVDEDGYIDPGQRADYQTAVRRFLHMSPDGTGVPAYQMVVTHMVGPRPPKGVEDNRVGGTTPVLDLFVEAQVATQRRRLR